MSLELYLKLKLCHYVITVNKEFYKFTIKTHLEIAKMCIDPQKLDQKSNDWRSVQCAVGSQSAFFNILT